VFAALGPPAIKCFYTALSGGFNDYGDEVTKGSPISTEPNLLQFTNGFPEFARSCTGIREQRVRVSTVAVHRNTPRLSPLECWGQYEGFRKTVARPPKKSGSALKDTDLAHYPNSTR
jgi:hypothetical protein